MSTRVERARRRRHGLATYRVVRYADDFVVMVYGSRQHTEAIREQIIPVLASVGLRLSEEKTTIAHLDEGLEFLGFRIQRQTKRGSHRRYVYTWVAKRSLTSIKAKVKTITRQGTNNPPKDLLRQLNPVLRGWTNYFRHAVAKQTFSYLQDYTWRRVWDGCDANTTAPTGSRSAAISAAGGPRTKGRHCSTPEPCPRPATATPARPSPTPGHHSRRQPHSSTDLLAAPSGEPGAVEVARPVCAVRRFVCIPDTVGRNSEELFLDRPAHLDEKPRGDKSMPVTRWPSGGVQGGVPQDPRDMAKAGLLEVQSPAVKVRTHRNDAWNRCRVMSRYEP